MDYLDHPFRVATGSGRRPTPTEFVHLRKWLDKDERFLELHSYTDITNIDQQLDQTSKIMISNVMQRVIAQVIGQRDPGFVTIKGTDGGALHVYLADAATSLDILASLQAGTNMIGSVQNAGPSMTCKNSKIDIATTGTHVITASAPSGTYYICSIMFTVSGECTVALWDETSVISGVMNFGGTGQPMGLTHNFGLIPLVLTAGDKFQIVTVGGSVTVKGVITYYDA